jgi:hypothetical protein
MTHTVSPTEIYGCESCGAHVASATYLVDCSTCEASDTMHADSKRIVLETFFSQVDAARFDRLFTGARSLSTRIADATSEFEAAADATRYYLTHGAYAGFAIRPDGELVYVFSMVRGLGDVLVQCAILQGATHLDCFDGYLTTLYSRHGFGRVTSLPNWTPGGPDVVYMALNGASAYLAALGKAEVSLKIADDESRGEHFHRPCGDACCN